MNTLTGVTAKLAPVYLHFQATRHFTVCYTFFLIELLSLLLKKQHFQCIPDSAEA
jgi:hypothetical protein